MFMILLVILLLSLGSVFFFANKLSEQPKDEDAKQKLIVSCVIAGVAGLAMLFTRPKKNKVISVAQLGKGFPVFIGRRRA